MSRGALARAGLIVTGAFLASRILGWLRVVVLGNLFGSADEIGQLDAYYAAFRIPDLIFELVAAGAISSALIPVLSGLIDQRRARPRLARGLDRPQPDAGGAPGAGGHAGHLRAGHRAPAGARLRRGHHAADRRAHADDAHRPDLPRGGLHRHAPSCRPRTASAPTALAPVVYNASIIVGALLLGPALGIYGVAVGVVVGAIGHLLVQLPALRGHFTYSLRADPSDPAARQTFWLMLPRAIGMGANQITFLVNTALASTVAVGAVVSYTVAFSVLQIPLGVIGLPLGIVLLPSMSRALANGDETRVRPSWSCAPCACCCGSWPSSPRSASWPVSEVVELLFGWGFDEAALAATAAALGVFLIGLPAHSMNVILARAFYSGKDTVTPVTVAIVSVGVNVAISVATVGTLGIRGLALGIALGAWFEATTLTILLRRRHAAVAARAGGRRRRALAGRRRSSPALVAAGVLALDLAPDGLSRVVGLIIELTLAAGAGLAVYLLYSRLVRLPELARAVDLVRSAIRGR